MKKTVTLFACSLALLGLGSCANEDNPALGQGEGAISLSLSTDGTVVDAVPATRASQATKVPDASELAITMTKSDGTYSKTWASVADFPAEQPLKIGSYKITATYGNETDEGFDAPYYYGETNVVVEEGKTTEASVRAQLGNSMVSISYTDEFKNYFAQYSSQVHSEGGDFITFVSDETRPAYVRPGKVNLTLSITKPNGVHADIQPAEFEALARHHYHITLDVNNGQTGEGVLKITFDDSVVGEDVDVDLSDDVLSAPAPVVNASGFTPGTAYETMELAAASEPLRMTASAAGGIKSVTLTTQSDPLLAKGFPAEIDLMAATPAQQALLQTLGLDVKGLWKNPDKLAVIDFTNVFKNITGAGNHSFALVVKDKLGKVNLPVILEANTHAAEISLVSIGTAGVSDTRASVVVSSNAADGAASLSVETYSFGTWSKANIISSAANSRHKAVAASKNYTLTFSIPAAVDDLPVRVKFKDTVKATGTIKKHGALLELESENYVFGSYATFKLKCASATPASSLHFFAASSGSYAEMSNVSVDAANGRVTIKGFTPGTRYSVKASETASASDASAPVTITTEKALQLPDSDMENWYYTDSESHWKRYFLGTQTATYWGTNNPMTTGEGGNFAYVRISGTAPGDGGHSGKCAVISTQGWGKGNTAVGSYTGAVCHYVDPGLLHLGSSRSSRAADIFGTSDLDCGLAFASRPSALKFWAKYAPVNSADEALALAQVFDASGNVIASGQLIITKQDAFTEKSIPLTYAAGAAKAAKIYVKFLSTHLENGVSKNKNWVTPPPFGGDMGNGQYHGARLYVDDLSLSY